MSSFREILAREVWDREAQEPGLSLAPRHSSKVYSVLGSKGHGRPFKKTRAPFPLQ